MDFKRQERDEFFDIEPIDGVTTAPAPPLIVPTNDNEPSPKNLDKFVTEALAIEQETAREAGALGFMVRALVQARMPHKQVNANEFERTNGAFTMTMLAPSKIGLPYGSVPRLLVSYLTTEAVRTKEREVILGNSLSGSMRELGLLPTGGRWGTIPRLKEQMTRLFACSISCSYTAGGRRLAKRSIDGAYCRRLKSLSGIDPDQR